MALKNTTNNWGWLARSFHWIMALMIFFMIAGGLRMTAEKDLIAQFAMVQQHKSFGFVVFTLAVLRVVWRLANPTPALPDTMPGWQKTASHASHLALYALIIAIPLSGWLMVTSSPLNDVDAYPVQIRNMVFGLFEMPDLFATGEEALSHMLRNVHDVLGKLLILVLLVHVGAALKHHVVDGDRILRRMVRD
jgi:cytochrome b561